MNDSWSVVITGEQWAALHGHLFPGDGDEHGLVLRCGIARSPRGTRLLVRDVVPATDGVDYVEGSRGYRKLTAEFVRAPSLGDVPYPVMMEPNLVVEYYAKN